MLERESVVAKKRSGPQRRRRGSRGEQGGKKGEGEAATPDLRGGEITVQARVLESRQRLNRWAE